MRNSAAGRKAIALVALASAGLCAYSQSAAAQSCTITNLNDNICANSGGSIDDYINCYRDLYENNVIKAFGDLAKCTHVKAIKGIRSALEGTTAQIEQKIEQNLKCINASITGTDGTGSGSGSGSGSGTGPCDEVFIDQGVKTQQCISDMNAIANTLQPYIDAERAAPDLEAYRRTHYTPDTFTFFENLVLLARQGRAACDGSLQVVRRSVAMLSDLQVRHPDYCQILSQSADYNSVARVDALAQWTKVDPKIQFNQYFDFEISLNTQCGYYDFSGAGPATIQSSTCPTVTAQYSQTLTGLDGALGWLSANRAPISAVGGATAGTILLIAGYGNAAGPVGALVGAAVGLVISGIEYISLQHSLNELDDLIDTEEQKLKATVAENVITPEEFANLMTEQCSAWAPTTEDSVHKLLDGFDTAAHLKTIDDYYALSDGLNSWYDGLFQWAVTAGADGTTFISQLAQQALLAQRNQFDQQVFAARAAEDIADAKNRLTNIKATVTKLSCSNLSPVQKRLTRSSLNAGLASFNRQCVDMMSSVSLQPEAPIAFTDPALTSSVVCSYNGFHNNVASLEIQDGDGFASNMVLKDATGAVLAQLTNVTSDTDFTAAGLPGFSCGSDTLQPFGTSAASHLQAKVYPLHVHDNLLGVQDTDASALRTAVQSLDSQMRFAAFVCARQLGATAASPHAADTCGIPNVQ